MFTLMALKLRSLSAPRSVRGVVDLTGAGRGDGKAKAPNGHVGARCYEAVDDIRRDVNQVSL